MECNWRMSAGVTITMDHGPSLITVLSSCQLAIYQTNWHKLRLLICWWPSPSITAVHADWTLSFENDDTFYLRKKPGALVVSEQPWRRGQSGWSSALKWTWNIIPKIEEDIWKSEDLYPVLQLNDNFLELFDFFIVYPDSLNMQFERVPTFW